MIFLNDSVVTDAFEKVIHYDIRINEAEIELLENRKYKVTVTYQKTGDTPQWF